MSNGASRANVVARPEGQISIIRDRPQLILKILIILALCAWIAQQCSRGDISLGTLIVLIIVFLLLLILIVLQRHFINLHCKLTAPGGCVQGYNNILAGRVLEPVQGDAYGSGFNHYLLEVRDPNGNLLSGVVVYRDGAGNPDTTLTQGNTSVIGGTLGWVDVEKAASLAGIALLYSTTFEITLRVFAYNGTEVSPPCKISFTLSVSEVCINQVSVAWSVDFTNPDEPLRVSDSAAATLATVGGSLHVRGAANVYGCSSEKIDQYTVWAIPDPTFSFAQPAPLTAVAPGASWIQLAHIQFLPQVLGAYSYSADDVRSLNVLDGDPIPDILTNVWGTRTEVKFVHVNFHFFTITYPVPALKPKSFNSYTVVKQNAAHEAGTGKFTILLQVIDTAGNQLYDIQRVWIDNEPVHAVITGIAGLAPCADLYMKTPGNVFKTVDVQGTAWDQLIDLADPTTPTSDNFDHYLVQFRKQGAASWITLKDSATPIPARPNPVGVGTLTSWNLKILDAHENSLLPVASQLPADQVLDKGEECTYDVGLQVWDKTIVNEGTVHWSGLVTFPIKIINGPEH